MVKVKVVFFASFRDIFNPPEVEVECDGTFTGFLDSLTKIYGEKVWAELFNKNDLNPKGNVIVLVNGRSLMDMATKLKDIRLNDNDRIAIMPPVGGG